MTIRVFQAVRRISSLLPTPTPGRTLQSAHSGHQLAYFASRSSQNQRDEGWGCAKPGGFAPGMPIHDACLCYQTSILRCSSPRAWFESATHRLKGKKDFLIHTHVSDGSKTACGGSHRSSDCRRQSCFSLGSLLARNQYAFAASPPWRPLRLGHRAGVPLTGGR
jgi:hypothetical protein